MCQRLRVAAATNNLRMRMSSPTHQAEYKYCMLADDEKLRAGGRFASLQ